MAVLGGCLFIFFCMLFFYRLDLIIKGAIWIFIIGFLCTMMNSNAVIIGLGISLILMIIFSGDKVQE